MVKKCEVLINNEAVTVIKFGGHEVQIPAIKKDVKFVNVLFENGKYIVVGDDYKENKKVEQVKVEPVKTTEAHPTVKPNYNNFNKKTTHKAFNKNKK